MSRIITKHPVYNKADIFIDQPIGNDGITAKQFKKELATVPDVDTINLYINSTGGDYDQGMEMYMDLCLHRATINGFVQGEASSIASTILMSADERAIASNSWLMLHPVSCSNFYRRKEAEKLMVNIYSTKTGLSSDDIRAIMESTTYLDANDCIETGFADYITPPVPHATNIMQHRTEPNFLAHKYPSVATAKAKRKNKVLRNQINRCSNVAADILTDRYIKQLT